MKAIKLIVLLATLISTNVFAAGSGYAVQSAQIYQEFSAQADVVSGDIVRVNLNVATVMPHCQGVVVSDFTEVTGNQVKFLEVIKLYPAPEPIVIPGVNGEETRDVVRVCPAIFKTDMKNINFLVEVDSSEEAIVTVNGSVEVKLTRYGYEGREVRVRIL